MMACLINIILLFQLSQTLLVPLAEASCGVQDLAIRPIQLFHHYGKDRIRRGIHLAPKMRAGRLENIKLTLPNVTQHLSTVQPLECSRAGVPEK